MTMEETCAICGKPCNADDEVVSLEKGFIDGQYDRFEAYSDSEPVIVCKECFNAEIEPLFLER